MDFKARTILLKDGRACILRSPGAEDARAMLSYLKNIFGETAFMARYPEEVTMSIDEEAVFLEQKKKDERSLMLAAFTDGMVIASAGVSCVGCQLRVMHRASFGLSVQKDYWHLGLGTALLDEVISWAKAAGYEQLELEVVCDNKRALALYEKCGFVIYGTREKGFKYKDGTYGDEHLMLRRL